jgi:hypothetical protein
MKTNQLTSTVVLAGFLLAAFALTSTATIIQTSQSSSSSDTAFDGFIAVNLIQAGQSSLSSATADASALNGTFLSTGLNDGSAAGNANLTYYEVAGGNGTVMPNTAIFQLTAGYNLTNIQVISGWTDHNLGEQTFQVLFSIGGGAFTNFGTFTNHTSIDPGTSGPGAWMTTLTASTGAIATNVTGIEFIFLNPDPSNGAGNAGASQAGSNGGTVIHELQVFGTYYTNLAATINLTNVTASYQTDGSSSSTFDSYITINLIQAGQSSLNSSTADTSALNGTFSASGLNDGSATGSANLTYYSAAAGNGTVMPNTAVFKLIAGYNITNIQVISGWGDHNLGEQDFQVLLSLGGGAFMSIGTFTNTTSIDPGFSGPGSWMTTITGSNGTIATNVTGIEFVFMNPDTSNGAGNVGASQAGDGSTGGTVIHELQVFGTYYTNLNGTAPTVVIPVTDSNVLAGLTLNDWVHETNFISSTVEGASLTVGFMGTQRVALQVDNTQLSGAVASRYPILAWSVNGGPYQSHQLAAGETSVVLATGVTNPVIDLYIEGMSPFEDRYTGDVPPNSVKITGFLVASNTLTAAAVKPGNVWLNIGDSIMAGDAALYAAGQGRPPDDDWAAADDARASYGYLLARHYGCQETRLAYGGYDWAGGLANVPALATLIDQKTSTISRLTGGFLNPIPNVVLINLGENGAPALSDVTNALMKLRSRVSPATKILVMVPVAGTAELQVTQAFNSYTNSTLDKNAFLVDLGSITYDTADGQHPTAQGHQAIFLDALPFFDPILMSAAINLTNVTASYQTDGSSSSTFDSSITINLVQAGQSSLSSSTADASALNGLFSASGLNDGSAAGNVNLTYYAATAGNGTVLPNTAVFQLTAGYNITNLQVISGWTDHNLGEQDFQVLFSIGGGVFSSIGSFTNNTSIDPGFSGPGSWMTTITGSNGTIATNVTGIEFFFLNPDTSNGAGNVGASQAGDNSTGGTVIHELQVFGTPATPVVNLTVQIVAGHKLQLAWPQGVLLQATNIAGPWTTNAAALSPFILSPTAPRMFYRVQVQ